MDSCRRNGSSLEPDCRKWGHSERSYTCRWRRGPLLMWSRVSGKDDSGIIGTQRRHPGPQGKQAAFRSRTGGGPSTPPSSPPTFQAGTARDRVCHPAEREWPSQSGKSRSARAAPGPDVLGFNLRCPGQTRSRLPLLQRHRGARRAVSRWSILNTGAALHGPVAHLYAGPDGSERTLRPPSLVAGPVWQSAAGRTTSPLAQGNGVQMPHECSRRRRALMLAVRSQTRLPQPSLPKRRSRLRKSPQVTPWSEQVRRQEPEPSS